MTVLTKRPRVRWTFEEQEVLIEKSIEHLLKRPHDSLIEALRVAQKSLPGERRRKLDSIQVVAKPLIKAIEKTLAAKDSDLTSSMEKPSVDIESSKVSNTIENLIAQAVIDHPKFDELVQKQQAIENSLTDISLLLDKMIIAIKGTHPRLSEILKSIKEPEKSTRIKLGVIGLLPHQRDIILKELTDVQAKCIGFIDKDKLNARDYDKVIAIVNFIDHRIMDFLYKNYTREQIILYKGGLQLLSEEIIQVLIKLQND